MKTIKPNEQNRVSGSLQRLVRHFFPEIAMTRTESLEALKAMQQKINTQKLETDEWRKRALKAEEAFANSIRFAKEEANRCDMGWRLF